MPSHGPECHVITITINWYRDSRLMIWLWEEAAKSSPKNAIHMQDLSPIETTPETERAKERTKATSSWNFVVFGWIEHWENIHLNASASPKLGAPWSPTRNRQMYLKMNIFRGWFYCFLLPLWWKWGHRGWDWWKPIKFNESDREKRKWMAKTFFSALLYALEMENPILLYYI